MKSAFKYSFLTCALAYILIAIPLVIFFSTLGRGTLEPIVDVRGMLSTLTLMLPWWNDVYYLAFLVPLLISSCSLIIFLHRFDGEKGKRSLFAGLSIFAYYLLMFLFLIFLGLSQGWDDIGYDIIWLWPLFGFGFGYAAATIIEKTSKLGTDTGY